MIKFKLKLINLINLRKTTLCCQSVIKMSRKVLTFSERVKAITLHDGGKSSRDVAQIMGVGRTQIQQIIKRRSEVLEDYENNVSSDRKRKRHKTGNEDINDLCWDWVQDAIRRRINVTGPMIKEKGLKCAADLDNESFKASNGWLDCFLKCHNIVFGKMSGERGDVKETTMNEWKEKLPQLCEGYKSEDIFNMDETGLSFRDTTRYTFHKKGDDCAGGKRSKERLTKGNSKLIRQ